VLGCTNGEPAADASALFGVLLFRSILFLPTGHSNLGAQALSGIFGAPLSVRLQSNLEETSGHS